MPAGESSIPTAHRKNLLEMRALLRPKKINAASHSLKLSSISITGERHFGQGCPAMRGAEAEAHWFSSEMGKAGQSWMSVRTALSNLNSIRECSVRWVRHSRKANVKIMTKPSRRERWPDDEYLDAAHKHCSLNHAELKISSHCGCFYCLSVFAPVDIVE